MCCYHPSQDDLDVCITAAATQKKRLRREPPDPAGTANLQSLHNRSAWFSRRPLIAADLNYSRDSGVFLSIVSIAEFFSQSSAALPRPHEPRLPCDRVVTVMGRIIQQTLFEPSPV